ncbi:Uncharacterised protein [Mycobacteroides abscessus subsp. massiliense]|nr:Uncharacterised protein [Mycobacteroides abscessus subsp. massiliense]
MKGDDHQPAEQQQCTEQPRPHRVPEKAIAQKAKVTGTHGDDRGHGGNERPDDPCEGTCTQGRVDRARRNTHVMNSSPNL